ncbi:MAG TPA: DUF2203 domain-containing protein [Gaiellaceae bacterium]|nr:DUF2203 domain-containing protein [Gaiellaceae bacterium]
MPEPHFTLAEATAALVELRPVAERMVELHASLAEAAARRAVVRTRIAGNGGGLGATEIAELDAEIQQLGAAVAACVDRIAEDGVQVKDAGSGLLDFPALREGREILLCWRVGEDEIAFWHGADEGFAGRKPVDFVE